MQKRIVVLGGAGFIGTHLCLRLLADGNEVFCVDVRDAAGSSLLRDVLRHPAFHAVRHNIVHGFGIRCDEIYNRTYREEFDVDTRIARIYNSYGSGAGLMDQRLVMKSVVAALRNRDIRINGSGEQMLPIVRRYRIRTVPTQLLFHRGEEHWRRSGITSYEKLAAALEQTEALIHATPH